MRSKIYFLFVFAIIMAEGVSQAQSDYKNMSRTERNQRMEELLYFDVNDMSISTDSMQFIKKDLELFGNMRAKRNSRLFWWGLGGMCSAAVLGPVFVAVGANIVGAVLAGVGLTAGFVLMMIPAFDTKAGTLLSKSRLIVVDASIPLMQCDNLAFGVSVFHNNVDRSTAFGPSMSIRF